MRNSSGGVCLCVCDAERRVNDSFYVEVFQCKSQHMANITDWSGIWSIQIPQQKPNATDYFRIGHFEVTRSMQLRCTDPVSGLCCDHVRRVTRIISDSYIEIENSFPFT